MSKITIVTDSLIVNVRYTWLYLVMCLMTSVTTDITAEFSVKATAIIKEMSSRTTRKTLTSMYGCGYWRQSCHGADGALRHMMPRGLGSRQEPINMSLLVIYLWLALVAIMIIITVIIFKYKQPVWFVYLMLHIIFQHSSLKTHNYNFTNSWPVF